jgi:polyferredoxin
LSGLVLFLLRAKRRWLQLVSFVLMNSVVLQGLKSIPCLGMNCYACPAAVFACPIGTLQHFAALRQVPLYTLGLLGLVGVLVGRLACGWLCPFGWLQELAHGLGRRLRWPTWPISDRFRWLPYAFLVVLAVIVPMLTLEPWFSKLCPVGTLEAAIPWVLIDPGIRSQIGMLYVLKLVILLAFVIWMVHTKRPFCRFVCPLGAIWSPFNRVSTLRLAVDEASCTECGACQRVCPVDMRIYEDAGSTRCIRCMECIKVCPEAAIRLTGE